MRSLDNAGDISQVLVGPTLTIIDELTKYHIFRCSDITTDARRKVDFDSAGKLHGDVLATIKSILIPYSG